jgi:Uma2 family endonuclease
MPLNVGPNSDPEPDASIVPKPTRIPVDHPYTSPLVIEVSDSTLRTDRRKAKLYAGAGVGEYWIVNIADEVIEVHRQPIVDQERFAETFVVSKNGELSTIAKPEVSLKVAALFE